MEVPAEGTPKGMVGMSARKGVCGLLGYLGVFEGIRNHGGYLVEGGTRIISGGCQTCWPQWTCRVTGVKTKCPSR